MPDILHTAQNLLARREHSALELEHKLKLRGYEQEAIDNALSKLAADGLQSDTRFSESYVAYRMNRGYGPKRIALELKERGIEQNIIDQFITDNDKIWNEKALDVKAKKFGKNTAKDWQEQAKQMRFLQYRGFTSEQMKYGIESETCRGWVSQPD